MYTNLAIEASTRNSAHVVKSKESVSRKETELLDSGSAVPPAIQRYSKRKREKMSQVVLGSSMYDEAIERGKDLIRIKWQSIDPPGRES